jgi:signal transduction histidine kinase
MSTNEKVNILMVDDQPAKLLSYEAILSDLGENLIRANSGREALDVLLKTDIAVLLVDVCMPDLDGFELATMVRQHPRFQKTAIILISAIHLTDLDRLKGYECGAVDYVPVPVVPEILKAKVSVFAELYRKNRELERLNRELEQRVAERTADLEASAERLREADRRKDEFLATLAHELRNPLAPVASAAKILRMKETSDPDLEVVRTVIDRQVEHLTRLIDDLLDVSRISRNKLELRKKRIALTDVLEAALESSRPLIERQGHQLRVKLLPHPVYLNGDLIRLAQVFTNLLNNSAQYTKTGGTIWVTAEDEGDTVAVHVKDNGIGISADKLSHIFEMFYQNDTSLEQAHGGLGIGLTLASRLVEMHSGRVEAYSEGLDQGSEFIVRLPMSINRSEQSYVPEPATTTQEKAQNGRRVLVADDNEDSAQVLALLLSLQGYQVKTAYDGLEALEVAAAFQPDAVLLDIGMPRLNGYEVARRLREQPWGEKVLLIAQTGWGQDTDRRRSEEAGFNAHFTKPLDHEALIRLLSLPEEIKRG